MTSAFLIYLDPDDRSLSRMTAAVRLKAGIYVLRSDLTRSRVYHKVKALTEPATLLVAPLQDKPKFKGMDAGALKALQVLLEAE